MDSSVLYIIPLAALGIYMHIESYLIHVKRINLHFKNLPTEFDGFKILHLSDLHIRKYGLLEKKTRSIISAEPADICFTTGDIASKAKGYDIFRELCASIPNKPPFYTVLGNTEHKPWSDSGGIKSNLQTECFRQLDNESTVLIRDTAAISVVGVDDAYSRHCDVNKAYSDSSPNDFTIFLTHCPSATSDAIKHRADLILAGHTHGGQVRFPGIPFFWTHMRKNKRLNDGLYDSIKLSSILGMKIDESQLYVNRGVGTSRIHIRLFCKPEITYITLYRSKA